MKKQSSVAAIALLSFCSFGISSSFQASAQEIAEQGNSPANLSSESADEIAWLYENSDIPVHKDWTFGVLDNGLRYAVKKNRVPVGQVSIRVRVDAGSLHENEDELGYAHLVEHLAFRGSTYVNDGEAKRIWQRFGVSFGSDSNAQTTPTQTVYQLDIPNAGQNIGNEVFSESMKILSGMIRNPGLSEKAVEAEKLIVQAEKREGDGAQRRVSNAIRQHFFQGQRLSERQTIGTVATLKKATAQGLKAFHKRWYRPEKTVIVISGDVEPAIMASMIEQYYSDWKVEGQGAQQPDFGQPIPSQNGDIDAISSVIVEDDVPTSVTLFYARPWFQKADTIVYNEQLFINTVAELILNRRLESVARYSKDFWAASIQREDISRSADATYLSIRPSTDDWEKAVKAVRAIIQDSIENPPSQADIDREVQTYADAIKTYINSYPFENSSAQVDDIVRAVDIRESVAHPDTVAVVFNNMRDKFTQENILKATQNMFDAPVRRAVFVGSKSKNDAQARLATILNEKVTADTSARLADAPIGLDALPNLGEPGTLAGSIAIDEFGTEILQLSNGVRALIQPNKAEADQVRVLVRFGNGYQSVDPKDGAALWAGPLILQSNGLGDLRQEQLDQLSISKRLSLNFGITDDAFEFTAATRPDDLEGQLHLIAAKITQPAWDPAPVNRVKLIIKQSEASANLSAQSVLRRDLDYLLKSNDLRWKSPQGKELDAFNADQFRKTWEPLLKEGPIEVIVFGDFERAKLIASLEKTFGAIESRTAKSPTVAARTISFPKAKKSSDTLYHRGPKDQAAAVLGWPTGGGTESIRNSRHLEILSSILRDRLFERFRSEEAASYSPDVFSNWPKSFDKGGFVLGFAQVQPQNIERFYAIAREIAQDLKTTPVSQDELQRAVEPLKQRLERSSTGNSFWIREMKGVSFDRSVLTRLSTLYSDYINATPQDIQTLAQQYLIDDNMWTLQVLPEQ